MSGDPMGMAYWEKKQNTMAMIPDEPKIVGIQPRLTNPEWGYDIIPMYIYIYICIHIYIYTSGLCIYIYIVGTYNHIVVHNCNIMVYPKHMADTSF